MVGRAPRQASLRVVVGSLGESSQNFIFGEEVTVPLSGCWARSVCVCVRACVRACVCRGLVTCCQRHLALGGRGLEEHQ